MRGVRSYSREGGPATVEVESLDVVPDLVSGLAATGVRITKVTPHEPTLEELYFAVRRGTHNRAPAPPPPPAPREVVPS